MLCKGSLVAKLGKCIGPTWAYTPIIITVEIGFNLNIYKTNVFDGSFENALENIPVGEMITFTGYMKTHGARYSLNLTSLKQATFAECQKCCAPLMDDCKGWENTRNEKLDGLWTVTARHNVDRYIKLYLHNSENVLGIVAFSNSWYFNTANNLNVDDRVKICGWRDEDRHSSFTIFEKV